MKPLVCALGVSRKDAGRAVEWLRWVALLESQIEPRMELVVCYTRDLPAVDFLAMYEARGCMQVQFHPIPDMQERGYPGSASHLFYRTMSRVESDFPDHPVLWCESDAVPMRAGWFQEIEAEYIFQNKPFMGHLELSVKPPHMAGVAVYPPDWRHRSPRLSNCHQAPDIRQWGRGLGQAFDTYAGAEILPQATQAGTIQQVWGCPKIDASNIDKLIKPETALFHPCKTGMLIRTLMERSKVVV